MAESSGTKTSFVPDAVGNYGREAQLLDAMPFAKATAGALDGKWVEVSTLKAATVQVEEIVALTGNVNIEGTNKPNPVDGDTGVALCTAFTAAGIKTLTMPVRFIRARMDTWTAGTVTVRLHGVA